MKTILTFALVLVMGFSYATQTNTQGQTALKNFHTNLSKVFQDEVRHHDNYFYQNNISKMNQSVDIIVRVNDRNGLDLMRVSTQNPDVINYVKYVIGKYPVDVDSLLTGRYLKFRLTLAYSAH